jgi:hypothetical protein
MIWSLVADVVVAGFLGVTIYFCYRLNQHLVAFRDGREEMQEWIDKLNQSIGNAEQTIAALRKTQDTHADKLQMRIEKAEFIANDLDFMIDRAGKLAAGLGVAVQESREERPKTGAGRGMMVEDEPLPPVKGKNVKSGIETIAKKADPAAPRAELREDNARSKAEKELLEALKSIR